MELYTKFEVILQPRTKPSEPFMQRLNYPINTNTNLNQTLLKDLKLGCAVVTYTLCLIHHCTVYVWLLMAGFVLLQTHVSYILIQRLFLVSLLTYSTFFSFLPIKPTPNFENRLSDLQISLMQNHVNLTELVSVNKYKVIFTDFETVASFCK